VDVLEKLSGSGALDGEKNGMVLSGGLVLRLDDFETPYTSIPEKQSDFVRLKKTRYARGYYRMEGVRGYELFHLKKPIQVTRLEVKDFDGRWKTLMVDDPMHWLGMGELAEQANPGSVLVAGLGMGLILHHLAKRKDISKITVVEIDPEVIKFVRPYIPKDERIEIIEDNFFSYVTWNPSDEFNTVIIDLWVLKEGDAKERRRQVAASMGVAKALSKRAYPRAKVLIWGVRCPQ